MSIANELITEPCLVMIAPAHGIVFGHLTAFSLPRLPLPREPRPPLGVPLPEEPPREPDYDFRADF